MGNPNTLSGEEAVDGISPDFAPIYRQAWSECTDLLAAEQDAGPQDAAAGLEALTQTLVREEGGPGASPLLAPLAAAATATSDADYQWDRDLDEVQARALMERILRTAVRDARWDAVKIARHLMTEMPATQLPGVARGIGLLEEHLTTPIEGEVANQIHRRVDTAWRVATTGNDEENIDGSSTQRAAPIASREQAQRAQPNTAEVASPHSPAVYRSVATSPMAPKTISTSSAAPLAGTERAMDPVEVGRLVDVGLRLSSDVTQTQGRSPGDAEPRPAGVLVGEWPASFCPPIGKPLASGGLGIFSHGVGRASAIFRSESRGADGKPIQMPIRVPPGTRAKMGGRIDLNDGYYLIIGGGKAEAREVLRLLGSQ